MIKKMANAGEVRAKLVLDNAQFRQGVSQARQDMQGLSAGAASSAKGMSMLNTASAAAGVAVVAAVGASVSAAANFEQSMAKVKAISGATDVEFKALESTAKNLGATTQFSASQAAEGLSFLSMAGFKAQDSINALPAVLNLAAVGQIELGKSADIASNIMTGFGLSSKETDKAVDILAKTMTTANTDLDMLGMAMKYVAPVASALGWDMTDAATAVAKMSDAGIQGSQAGTSLRAALLSLANPTGQTAKAMDKLGISVTDANGQFKPLPELIGHISGKMVGMTDAQKTVTAAQLVGTEASAGFLALLKQGQPALQDYKTSLEESGGTAERVAKIQQDTLIGAWNQVKSAAEGLAINLGQALLPAFTAVAQGAATLIGGLAQLDPAFLAGGLAAAAFASGAMLVVNNMSKVIAAVRLLGATLLTNPATAWIAGVSLAIGALTTVLMKASGSTREYKEVSLDTYKSLGQQATELTTLADRHDALRGKIGLSSDELLRYKDLQGQIAATEEGDSKQKLIDEYEQLGQKAGVTKEEMAEYLKVNDDIISKAPNTATAFDNKGNAIAKTSDEARKLADSYKEMQRVELELQHSQLLVNQSKDIETLNQKTKEYVESKKRSGELEKEYAAASSRYAKDEQSYQEAISRGNERQIENAREKVAKSGEHLANVSAEQAANGAAGASLQAQIGVMNQKAQQGQQIVDKIIQEELAQHGLTAAKGEEISIISEKISATEQIVSALEAEKSANGELTAEQQQQLDNAKQLLEALGVSKEKIEAKKASQEQFTNSTEKSVETANKLNDSLDKPNDKKVTTNIDEEKKKADELHEKSEKPATKKTKGDNSHANSEIDKTDEKAKKENTKKTKGDNSHANSEIEKSDKKAQKENTKKTKGDNSHVNSEIDKTDNKAKKENTKNLKGNNSDANAKIDETDRKGKQEVTKPLDMDDKQAKARLDEIKREATKPERKSIFLDIKESITRTVDNIFGNAEKRHNGGTLHQVTKRPKYHNGGSPRGLVANGPKFDEVDARLLKNEMVLTQAQQARLFDFIRTANRPTTVSAFSKPQGDQVGNTTMSVNINVAEMSVRDDQDLPKLAQQVSQELAKQQRSLERSRGR
ncbi:phage tail tape measure protein [Bacillus mycoides]|uniref:phage tail tape measure protein n=1 Tax=Bacillus mycoides TaxID=1405 RepID=UPI002570E207|nr:phage tail tape measure protein [Bacillus mycoides]WJE75874.1 phage tail tape measure protein [Bacillus mycoides]